MATKNGTLARFDALNSRLTELTTALGVLTEWRVGTEARLASGNQKFDNADKDMTAIVVTLKEMNGRLRLVETAERRVIATATAVGAFLGTASGIITGILLR